MQTVWPRSRSRDSARSLFGVWLPTAQANRRLEQLARPLQRRAASVAIFWCVSAAFCPQPRAARLGDRQRPTNYVLSRPASDHPSSPPRRADDPIQPERGADTLEEVVGHTTGDFSYCDCKEPPDSGTAHVVLGVVFSEDSSRMNRAFQIVATRLCLKTLTGR